MRFMPKRQRAEEDGEHNPIQKKERRDAFGRDLRDVLDDERGHDRRDRELGDYHRREIKNRCVELVLFESLKVLRRGGRRLRSVHF